MIEINKVVLGKSVEFRAQLLMTKRLNKDTIGKQSQKNKGLHLQSGRAQDQARDERSAGEILGLHRHPFAFHVPSRSPAHIMHCRNIDR